MDERENLKKVIKAIQKRYNLKSQRMIISTMGYSTWGYLSDLFSGKVPISDKFLASLAKTYNINAEYVRTGEGDIFQPDPDPLDEPIEIPGNLLDEEFDKLLEHPGLVPPEEKAALIENLDHIIRVSEESVRNIEKLKRVRLLLTLPPKEFQEQLKKLRETENANGQEQAPDKIKKENERDQQLIIDNMKKNIALLHLRFMSITEQTSRAQQIVNPIIFETKDEDLKKKLERLADCLVNILKYSIVLDELP